MNIKDWEDWAKKQNKKDLQEIKKALDIIHKNETINREFGKIRMWIFRNIIEWAINECGKNEQDNKKEIL